MSDSEILPATASAAELASLAELALLVEKCRRAGVSRNALLLSARRMPAHLMRPHHLRLVHEAIGPLTRADRARNFSLPDGSRAVTWRGDAGPLLAYTLSTLGHLLAGEPEPAEIGALARLYTLPHDAERMFAEIHGPGRDHPPNQNGIRTGAKLSAAGLQNLEHALAQMDVSRFARHRQVWRVMPDSRLETAWDKRFLAVDELAGSLLPGCDPTADPWLFRRLSRTLDRRLLALLGAPDELRTARPFSLDLNVSTLLAPEFLRFDAALPAHLRGKLLIDLLAADILADPAAYMFALGFARSRRYRVMIREVSPGLLAALDFTALDPDLIELAYSPGAAPLLARAAENPPPGAELVLAYANPSSEIDQAARAFASSHAIRLLAPRD